MGATLARFGMDCRRSRDGLGRVVRREAGRGPKWPRVGFLVLVCGVSLLTSRAAVLGRESGGDDGEAATVMTAEATLGELEGESDSIALVDGGDTSAGLRSDIHVLAEGSSDDETLAAAKRRLPLASLSPKARARVSSILENLSMFRAMPTIQFPVDHDAYRFLVSHPDVGVSTWRALGVSKCHLWQTGPQTYETAMDNGSLGVIDVLLREPHNQLVIGEGKFKSPLLPAAIKAVGLFHLQTYYITRADGTTAVIAHANLFISFPSETVETAAQVISPWTNKVIDRNFQEVALYAHVISLAMKQNPSWVEHLGKGLDGILEESRQGLLTVTAQVHQSYQTHLRQLRKQFQSRQLRAAGGSRAMRETRSTATPRR